MKQKSNKSYLINLNNDKEIIKRILSEKESDALVKDKLYRYPYLHHQPMM